MLCSAFYFARNSFEVLRRWRKRGVEVEGKEGGDRGGIGGEFVVEWDKVG